MNILIVGEFSAFAKHLKKGFKELGHHVTIVMTGDGWKNIVGDDDDIKYCEHNLSLFGRDIPHTSIFSKFHANYKIYFGLQKRFINKKIDLIIVINYIFLSASWKQAGVKLGYIRKQKEKGSKLIMSVCGGDPATRFSHSDIYKEWGMENSGPLQDDRYNFLLKYSDSIIPTAYAYYDAIQKYYGYIPFNKEKISKAIPLPITIEGRPLSNNSCVGRKVVIFHGIIRPRMKGTFFIQPAMERLQKEYPDKVECICKGLMPYDEYVKLFENIDVLIDQASGEDGWGMNASIGAMQGKCVLVSCGEKTARNMGLSHPFVEIQRDTNQIYETLKELVLHPEKIDRIKQESRLFIEQYCESAIVANRYLNSVNL